MGNVQPHGFVLPTQVGSVNISTRSEPLMGFGVQREVGLVFGNSAGYDNRNQQAASQQLAHAISMMAQEAQRLGANCVLGVHVEVKELGHHNMAICQAYGTACVVGAR